MKFRLVDDNDKIFDLEAENPVDAIEEVKGLLDAEEIDAEGNVLEVLSRSWEEFPGLESLDDILADYAEEEDEEFADVEA